MNRILKKNSFPILLFPLIFVLFICGGFNKAQSQEVNRAQFNYVSPVPGSKFILPQNNIAIRHGDPIKTESLQNFSIQVVGGKSGNITGKIVLSDDNRTVIFKPDKPFAYGEEVQVSISDGLETKTGLMVEQKNFSFFITSSIPNVPADYFFKKEILYNNNTTLVRNNESLKKSELKDNNLPEDFPDISVSISEDLPPEGYYFLSPFGSWGWYPNAVPYIIIMDEYGIPVFYRKNPSTAFDFKKLSNDNMVYYANFGPWYKWVIEDDAFNNIDDWAMQNGYWTDWHEFQFLSEEGHEGHVIVMANDPQFVDMSQIVPGGHPNAIVAGWIIQEQDINKNVVFQWRSWDHYLITDAQDFVDLTDSVIDPFHGNAIEVYSDTEWLLSARNLNEITKISRNTGEILWRLGGKNNMFEFVNDTLGFSVQHDCRRLDNGNISIFDNGTYHSQPFSSVIEYELDELDFTATLLKRYRHNPDAYGSIMGNGQETETGNMIAAWGSSGEPAITEFSPEGEILAEINIESINYRAYRYPWKTTYFLLETDTLQFGYIWHENTLTKQLAVSNNTNKAIELTSYYSMNSAFIIENELPISIPQNESVDLDIKFSPVEVGEFNGRLTINSDINSDTLVQRIAQQVYLIGNATSGQSVNLYNKQHFLVHPNPAHKELTIESSAEVFSGLILLHNAMGKKVIKREVENCRKIKLDISPLPNGIYFVCLIRQHNISSENFKIVKY